MPGYKRGSQHGHCALCVSRADDDLLYLLNITVSVALCLRSTKGKFVWGDLGDSSGVWGCRALRSPCIF